MAPGAVPGDSPALLYLDLSYDNKASDESARELVYTVQPKWRETPEQIEIVKFTDGITNTLLKICLNTPGLSPDQVDQGSVLMRAYGNNTDLLIDRDREAKSHALLAERGLAPPLLARFKNGLLYRYISGKVCTAQDLTSEPVWRGVAKRLGEWHARLPIAAVTVTGPTIDGDSVGENKSQSSSLARRSPVPNIWSVMQRWVGNLPISSAEEQARKEVLQKELDRSFEELDNEHGIGDHGFIFGHCDLLSANVIILPPTEKAGASGCAQEVSFIDYEYATPCPAAFDISNHFAEWGGYDCDYNMLPTKSVRLAFVQDYLSSYNAHASTKVENAVVQRLADEIDMYRGMPGFYWGIWALIQAQISQINFDYASYAEVRLGEYWQWRAELDGTRSEKGEPLPLRERRWAQS